MRRGNSKRLGQHAGESRRGSGHGRVADVHAHAGSYKHTFRPAGRSDPIFSATLRATVRAGAADATQYAGARETGAAPARCVHGGRFVGDASIFHPVGALRCAHAPIRTPVRPAFIALIAGICLCEEVTATTMTAAVPGFRGAALIGLSGALLIALANDRSGERHDSGLTRSDLVSRTYCASRTPCRHVNRLMAHRGAAATPRVHQRFFLCPDIVRRRIYRWLRINDVISTRSTVRLLDIAAGDASSHRRRHAA